MTRPMPPARRSSSSSTRRAVFLLFLVIILGFALHRPSWLVEYSSSSSPAKTTTTTTITPSCPTVNEVCLATVCGELHPCPATMAQVVVPVPTTMPMSDLSSTAVCTIEDCLSDKKLMDVEYSANFCRTKVLIGQGQGGLQTLLPETITACCGNPLTFGVCEELLSFTGLTPTELAQRLERHGHFHFEGEHMFWNPTSVTELAWYYATSVDYLFANSIHPGISNLQFTKEDGPILDYSGGVGNNVISLAEKGIKMQYFGIGQMEKSFAEYRFRKRGYLQSGLVEIKTPWNEATDWKFDPINGGLPRDGTLGGILAFDVLEHIPNYHHVAKAMVDSLRVGGFLLESTPFGVAKEGEDLRVHVSDGGIPMEVALGPRMNKTESKNQGGRWIKISD